MKDPMMSGFFDELEKIAVGEKWISRMLGGQAEKVRTMGGPLAAVGASSLAARIARGSGRRERLAFGSAVAPMADFARSIGHDPHAPSWQSKLHSLYDRPTSPQGVGLRNAAAYAQNRSEAYKKGVEGLMESAKFRASRSI